MTGLQKDPHHSKEVSFLHGVHKAHFALHIQGPFTSHVTFTDPWTAVTSPITPLRKTQKSAFVISKSPYIGDQ